MSKKFYAWKNRDCQGINPEWIELTGKQFAEICSANKDLPDEEKRWFYKLPGLEEGDDYLVFECTKEQYIESQNEKDRRCYQSDLKADFFESYDMLSFDFVYTDDSGEEYTLHDIVEDSRVNVVDTAFNNYFANSLYEAISCLNQEDKEFILYWIDKKRKGVSDMKIADSLGLTFKGFRYRFSKICKELKNFFEKN